VDTRTRNAEKKKRPYSKTAYEFKIRNSVFCLLAEVFFVDRACF
jgi:hypothetical protein